MTKTDIKVKPLTQKEEAAISSNKWEVLAFTDKHILCHSPKKLDLKPWYALERFEHYLGLLERFKDEHTARLAWQLKYDSVDEYLDSQT